MEDIEEEKPTRDAHGTELTDGDSVILISDASVTGSDQILAKDTDISDIRITDDMDEIEVAIDGVSGLRLRTEFVKKI